VSAVGTERETRWGILGPGGIANVFAEDIGRTPGARLVAVGSRDAARAQAFAQRHGADRHYGDYAALAADPDIDIVYVASPHSHHLEHARLLIEAGKAVLVEKPLALTAAEGEEIFSLARDRGVFAMEAMWTLCNPLFRELVRRVQAGEIGTPRAYSATMGPIGVLQPDHRVQDPALGGSFMLECHVYSLNILAALAPSLAATDRVSALSVVSDRGVDTWTSLTLTSAAGVATMGGGFVTGTDGQGVSTFHLVGDKGWLQVDDNLFNPGHAQFSSEGAPVEVITEPLASQRYRWEIEEAGRCLQAGEVESAIVPQRLTLDVLRLLDLGRQAAGLGPWR
jgi:predicted dehydrogenase